jgi:hypothetical protein
MVEDLTQEELDLVKQYRTLGEQSKPKEKKVRPKIIIKFPTPLIVVLSIVMFLGLILYWAHLPRPEPAPEHIHTWDYYHTGVVEERNGRYYNIYFNYGKICTSCSKNESHQKYMFFIPLNTYKPLTDEEKSDYIKKWVKQGI